MKLEILTFLRWEEIVKKSTNKKFLKVNLILSLSHTNLCIA